MSLNFKKKYKIDLADTLGQQHWYGVTLGKKFLGYFPSSTTILQAYPFSQQLVKWVAERGYDQAQEIKKEAGLRGTTIHIGIEKLLQKEILQEKGYSREEWSKLSAFVDWYREYTPEILGTEVALYSHKYGYAGRADVVCKISGQMCVGDWKTSGSIYDHFPLQVASYAQALEENTNIKVAETAILQLGAKNKLNYRFILYPDWRDHFQTFLNVFETWKYDTGYTDDFEPPVLDLPNELSLIK